MRLASIFKGRRKAVREDCVRSIVADVNRLDYTQIDKFLTEDVEVVDVAGASVSGIGAFAEIDRRFREATGRPQTIIESLDHNGDEVLVRGHLEGGSPDVNGETWYRIFFRQDKICRFEITRAHSQPTMPTFAARALAGES